jgi:hypothetical protein
MKADMDQEYARRLTYLLSKDVLKQNLAKAGLFALAYELLKNSIVERPKGFFTLGSSDDHYRKEVLSKHASPLIASCLWFQENGAITAEEAAEVLQFRDHRNHIAHELPNVLLDPKSQVDEAKLVRLFQLLCKIDRWWISEVEIPANPDFDGEEISPSEIRSGSMEFISYLIGVVYDLDGLTPDPVRPN